MTGISVDKAVILDKKDDLGAFRIAIRNWLADNAPAAGWATRLAGEPLQDIVQFQRDWLAQLESVGLAAPHWPSRWGGENLSTAHQMILGEELARAETPSTEAFAVSLNHVPATLYDWGSDEQIETYVPGVRRGVLWCQGFSEPNAGSDLASLRTRAELVGDKYVVNGQKIWSSFAHHAEYCLLLARTDPHAPKHKGISYFILDMKTPGITVRPITQTTGSAEFCEMFLDQVEIPAQNLIGEENNGWLIAQSTLSAERGILIFQQAERLQYFFDGMLRAAREHDDDWIKDSQLRREFMQCYTEHQGVRIMIRQMLAETERTGHLDDSAPFIKVLYSESRQRFAELILRIRGLESQLETSAGGSPHTFSRDKPMLDFLGTWSWTIAGGTNEIMRNIIAERLVGLPKEPRPG